MHESGPLFIGNAGVIAAGETRAPLIDPTQLPGVPAGLLSSSGLTPGAPVQNAFYWSIQPLAMQANNIALAQTINNGTYTLTAGTGVTTVSRNGVSGILEFDVARCIRLTGVTNTVAIAITINGYDDYWQPMTQTITGPAGATTVTTTKAFRRVRSITNAGNTVDTVAIGTSDVFGLPFRADEFGQLVGLSYNNAFLTASTGFTAAVTTTPSASTGDVRGTYAAQSASDGTKRLTALIMIKNNTRMDNVLGLTQF